jgi:hypothetical protein
MVFAKGFLGNLQRTLVQRLRFGVFVLLFVQPAWPDCSGQPPRAGVPFRELFSVVVKLQVMS